MSDGIKMDRMARIAADVVLLPDEAMTDRIIEINKQISREYSAEIVLNRENCLPHVSLAMGCVEPWDIDAIRNVLERLARETPARQLTATGIQRADSQKATILEIEWTQELQRLHERIMDEMEPLLQSRGHGCDVP